MKTISDTATISRHYVSLSYLALAQLTGFTVTQGPGTYLSGAIVAAVAAAWYGSKARPAMRHLMRGWARYASAR